MGTQLLNHQPQANSHKKDCSLRAFLRLTFATFAILVIPRFNASEAHEGHQPLPTKGVQVDTERGHITLSAQARQAIGLEAEEVAIGEVASTLTAYGETVSPWQGRAFGSAQISGRITRLLVRPGDTVVANQVIAELSSRELDILRLEYSQAKKDVDLNRELLELSSPSAAAGAVPMQRVLELKNALQQSENSLEIARVRAKTLGIDLKQLDQDGSQELLHAIRSPIAGKVIHSDLSEGKFVEAFEHLFEIANNHSVWVRIQLLEKDIHKVAVGQSVDLTFPELGLALSSSIDRLDMSMETPSQISWAWASISHQSVIPGIVCSARIRMTSQSDRLSIPTQAVFSDGLQSYVFVEEASTKTSAEYRKRNVVLGKRKPTQLGSRVIYTEMLQGDVYPGDRVVTKGGHELSSLFFLGVLKLTESDRTRLGIRTETAIHRSIAKTLDLAGIVSLPPQSRSVVTSQVAGTIHSHQLSPGMRIKRGETLLELVSPDFYAVQVDLIKTALDADLTRTRAQRLEEVRSDAFSRRLLLETQVKAEQLQARVDSLKRQLLSMGLTQAEVDLLGTRREAYNYLPIRAAMDGVLSRWSGTIGETVAANQLLVEIQDLQSVWMEAHVPVQDSPSFASSSVGIASLLSNPQIQFPVSVSRIGPVANEATRTQRVWLTSKSLPQEIQLRDQMQLSIALQTNDGLNALAVPKTAVLRDGIHQFVFVQKADGYIERRRVTTGADDGHWVEIKSGLAAGDEAIVAGGRELQTAYASLR